ncbi:hypothetical protein J6590_028994 [Homalodisca vitripennis]|nr:hypothetical protein J6590_028994 [Homalodisca vitripennis]
MVGTFSRLTVLSCIAASSGCNARAVLPGNVIRSPGYYHGMVGTFSRLTVLGCIAANSGCNARAVLPGNVIRSPGYYHVMVGKFSCLTVLSCIAASFGCNARAVLPGNVIRSPGKIINVLAANRAMSVGGRTLILSISLAVAAPQHLHNSQLYPSTLSPERYIIV